MIERGALLGWQELVETTIRQHSECNLVLSSLKGKVESCWEVGLLQKSRQEPPDFSKKFVLMPAISHFRQTVSWAYPGVSDVNFGLTVWSLSTLGAARSQRMAAVTVLIQHHHLWSRPVVYVINSTLIFIGPTHMNLWSRASLYVVMSRAQPCPLLFDSEDAIG